jgi:hypothetical protein
MQSGDSAQKLGTQKDHYAYVTPSESVAYRIAETGMILDLGKPWLPSSTAELRPKRGSE